jgi:hypothetical protein
MALNENEHKKIYKIISKPTSETIKFIITT